MPDDNETLSTSENTSRQQDSFLIPKDDNLSLPENTPYAPLYVDHYAAMHMEQAHQMHLHSEYYGADHHQRYNPYEQMGSYFPAEVPMAPYQHAPMMSPQPYEEEKQLICPHDGCGKTFKKQSSYHQHLKTHTNTPKPFLCRICSFSFSRSHDLKRHEYIHSKDKPFICENCNRGFSRRDALKRHLDSMKNRPGGCASAGKKQRE